MKQFTIEINENADDVLSVSIPLFGIKTVAKDLQDVGTAISEALECFCIASEKFGQGIEKELTIAQNNIEVDNYLPRNSLNPEFIKTIDNIEKNIKK